MTQDGTVAPSAGLSLFLARVRAGFATGWGWLCPALAIALVVRAYFLSQPMRGDEAYTFLVFANRGLSAIFDYSLPNNHVLNTLLVRFATALWGGSPAIIRLPAFLAGLAAIFAVYALARELVPYRSAGVFAATGMAVFPYLILYSTNARGYSLVVLFALLLALAGVRVAQRPAPMGSLVPALVSALGALAVPVMIFPIAGLFCWLVVLMRANGTGLRNILTRFVLPYLGLTALFGLLFYLPVILVSHGIAPLVSNKFVQPLAWNDFIARLGPQLLGSFAELTRDIPPVALLLWPALALVGIVAALRRHQTAVWCLLPALALGAGLVLLVQHSLPYGRTWIYLIPFALLVADSGLAGLLELLPGRLSMAFDTALVAAGLFFAINLMSANIIGRYPDTSAFPDAPLAVEYLKPILQPGDRLRITSTADWPVNYYLWADGIARPDEAQTAGTGRVFFIVKKSRGSIQEMTDRPVVKLLELDDLVLYEFQR